jgi:hypothetical protein
MSVFSVRRKTQSWYGETIGILILDAAYPCVPGNVGNATTFGFPVRYEVVKGASIDRLLNQRDPTLAQPFVEAAQRLRDAGVRAITGACGFMALFQREVAAAVDIPVLLTSLIQIPFIFSITKRPVGVVTANAKALTSRHFEALGIGRNIPLAIAGMEDQPEFNSAVLQEKGTLDSQKIENELVGVVRQLCARHPEIGAVLLECSDLPPYSKAVYEACALPVFDYTTMINYVHATLMPREHRGYM